MPKKGLDFFPLDTVLDTKFQLIEAEFGLKGFAIVVKLLQKIYQEEGYYCELTDDVRLLFSRKVGESCSLVSEIINATLRRGIFDKNLYERFEILTSAGIQKRYLEATSRRIQVDVKKDYLLVNAIQISQNVNILGGNVDINRKNVDRNPQSKESKVKKRKEEEERAEPNMTDEKKLQVLGGKLGKGVLVLSEDQIEKLLDMMPLNVFDSYCEKLSLWIRSNKPAKNHFGIIEKWYKEDYGG